MTPAPILRLSRILADVLQFGDPLQADEGGGRLPLQPQLHEKIRSPRKYPRSRFLSQAGPEFGKTPGEQNRLPPPPKGCAGAARCRGGIVGRGVRIHQAGRGLHRIDDLLVSRAAAEVPAQPLPDLFPRGFRFLLEERRCRQDHPRRTETALDGAAPDEGLLQRVEPVPLPQPFDRRHLSPLQLGGEHQAGEAALAVDEDRTGPAFPASAALLRSREPQLLPEEIDDPSVRGRLDRHLAAVDPESEVHALAPEPLQGLSRSASMIRSAVSGARVSPMPQASATALAMAGRGPLIPTSPTPFMP